MLEHLVEVNNLKKAMEEYGLVWEEDLKCIKELISRPETKVHICSASVKFVSSSIGS